MAATAESTPVPILAPVPEAPKPEAPPAPPASEEPEATKPAEPTADTASLENASFKEESNFVSDLKDHEKKALQELKARVEEAFKNNEFVEPPPKPEEPPKTEETPAAEPPKAEEQVPSDEKPVETKEELKAVIAEIETAPPQAITEEPKKEEASVSEGKPQTPETVGPAAEVVAEQPVAAAAEAKEPKPAEGVAATDVEEVKPEPAAEAEAADTVPPEEIYLWGVPLMPSKGDERTDVILLKFLRARDFKVTDAFTMLKNTVLWRKKFGADAILEEEFGNELDGVAYMHGVDKEGHPVCYNVYGMFQDKELYQKTFGDEAKRDKFLRWRVQQLEKSIRLLDFSPGGISSMVQITDFKNSPGLGKWEIRQATNKAVALLQDNYPEFVAKKIFINVPWWYLALNTMISPFITQRTKSKFVAARPARVSETLFKYISPEYVPVQYGGLSRENDSEFTAAEGGVSEQIVKAGAKQTVEIPITEVGSTVLWDLSVQGWEVSYGAEFVPSAESGYTVIIQKTRKFLPSEEPVRSSYKIGEPGKVVLTIDNTSSKRKKILYRSKIKSA
uniref:CRAL-TRIO domain-containing protein n=1 Tax=Araucaria cunninghamii TaxID=56994 RepID=A0A0D6R5T7_ARACU